MSAEKPVTYEAWRITYQSSEAAARAAFSACVTLRAALAIADRQRDEARERLEKLEALRSRLQMFLAAVGASTPDDHPWVVEARALANALRPCELATIAPAPQQGGEDD